MKRKRAYGIAILELVLLIGLPGAIKDLEKALELDPKNAQARNQLQQLK